MTRLIIKEVIMEEYEKYGIYKKHYRNSAFNEEFRPRRLKLDYEDGGPYIISIICVILLSAIFVRSVSNYSISYRSNDNVLRQHQNQKAFIFLLNSGRNRLFNNNIQGAYSEFKLAYKLDSNNKELNKLYLISLQMLCDKEELYCNELDLVYEKLID